MYRIALVVLTVFAFNSLSSTALCMDAPFLKAPYLLYTGANSEMMAIWQLDVMQNCTFEWGTDISYGLGNVQTSEYGDDHQHSFTMTGLVTGMMHFYQVSSGGTSFQGSFLSAPAESATETKFMVYGDCRTNYMTHDLLAEQMISTYMANPDYQSIVFTLGDMVEFGATDSIWQNEFFSDTMAHLKQRMLELPYVACLGNHELYYYGYTGLDVDTPLFGRYFPYPFVERRYWSLDYGPVHITVVDQYPDYYQSTDVGMISPAQLAWIESDLSSTDRPWKIILLHEPGWSAGSPYFPENNPDVQNLLQPLCEEYGVQIVFSAHNHYYSVACKNGVYHVTTAGGGAPLYTPGDNYPNMIYTYKDYHFCKIEIDLNILSLSSVTLDNQEIDYFEIEQDSEISHLLGFVAIGGGSGEAEDVLVSVNGTTDNPCEIGYYGIQLDPGFYDVTASLEGYTTQVYEDVEVIAGTETELDIVMNELSIEESGGEYLVSIDCCEPSPFSESTEINYQLESAGFINLVVYDISGRVINTLVNETQTGGEQLVVWHGIDESGVGAPSGVYFLVLSTGDQSANKKIVLLKQ